MLHGRPPAPGEGCKSDADRDAGGLPADPGVGEDIAGRATGPAFASGKRRL